MNLSVIIDWKFVVALGAATLLVIFGSKMSEEAAERVLTHAVDAYDGHAIAENDNY